MFYALLFMYEQKLFTKCAKDFLLTFFQCKLICRSNYFLEGLKIKMYPLTFQVRWALTLSWMRQSLQTFGLPKKNPEVSQS